MVISWRPVMVCTGCTFALRSTCLCESKWRSNSISRTTLALPSRLVVDVLRYLVPEISLHSRQTVTTEKLDDLGHTKVRSMKSQLPKADVQTGYHVGRFTLPKETPEDTQSEGPFRSLR